MSLIYYFYLTFNKREKVPKKESSVCWEVGGGQELSKRGGGRIEKKLMFGNWNSGNLFIKQAS